MKKLVLPLLFLLAVGMLLAVESAPSDVVGYVKYDAVAGLNFVAMPMVDGLTYTSEVGTVYNTETEAIDAINLWDNVSQTWVASNNYGGGFWDPDLDVATNSILYFNSTEALTYYSIGALPASPATYDIVAGLNTIMIPLNQSALTMTSEVGLTIGDGEYVDAINLWDNASQTWVASNNYGGGFWDPEQNVAIGLPLYVNAVLDTVWPARSGNVIGKTKSINRK